MTWYFVLVGSLLVGLGYLPLVIGVARNFEYEYTTLLSWALLLVLPSLSLLLPKSLVRLVTESPLPPVPGRLRVPRSLTAALFYLLVAPSCLLVAALGAFRSGQCLCSGRGFVFWFLLQTLPAYFFAAAVHWDLLRRQQHSGFSRPKTAGLLVVFGLGNLLIAAVLMWFFPQKRLASLGLGFIHGPVYDSWIPVDYGVALNRFTVVLLAVLIGTRCLDNVKTSLRARIAVFGLATATLSLWGASLLAPTGSHGKAAIVRELNASKGSGFLTVYYKKGDERYERRIGVLWAEAQFHGDEIIKILGITNPRPVDIFVYPSREVKKLYFGGGNTDVTDVWGPSIHITADDAPHESLRHELVHAVASQFGWHGLGFHPNMAVTEGLAVALAPGSMRRSLHELSAGLLHDKRIESLENLFSPLGFWSEAGDRSYTVAGSFITFLLERSGHEAVRTLYSGGDFAKVSGRSLGVWVEDWEKYVSGFYSPRLTVESEALYRFPGVLHDLCPHTKADYARGQDGSIFTRMRQPRNWDWDKNLAWRARFDSKDRSSLIDLWTRKVKELASSRALDHLALQTWVETAKHSRKWPSETAEDVELAVLESDLLAVLGSREESLNILSQLQAEAALKPPGEVLERQIAARVFVEQSNIGVDRILEWRRYLAGWRPLPEVQDDDPWITFYLKLKRDNRFTRESTMVHALLPFDEMDSRFQSESLRVLAERFLAWADFQNAESQYLRLAKMSDGPRKPYYEMLARLAHNAQRF